MSDEIPDLKSLLAEASRPWAEVTVPLNQGLRAEIEALEAELDTIAADAPRKRMGAESPLKVKAREIQAKRAEMEKSSVTFRFEALTYQQREQIRKDMDRRDDADEVNLRAIAAMCVSPAGVDWTAMRDLRDRLGVNIFDQTIDAAATRAGGGEWSVPFSSAASLILGTET